LALDDDDEIAVDNLLTARYTDENCGDSAASDQASAVTQGL
jgi:hypothetical protein